MGQLWSQSVYDVNIWGKETALQTYSFLLLWRGPKETKELCKGKCAMFRSAVCTTREEEKAHLAALLFDELFSFDVALLVDVPENNLRAELGEL